MFPSQIASPCIRYCRVRMLCRTLPFRYPISVICGYGPNIAYRIGCSPPDAQVYYPAPLVHPPMATFCHVYVSRDLFCSCCLSVVVRKRCAIWESGFVSDFGGGKGGVWGISNYRRMYSSKSLRSKALFHRASLPTYLSRESILATSGKVGSSSWRPSP